MERIGFATPLVAIDRDREVRDHRQRATTCLCRRRDKSRGLERAPSQLSCMTLAWSLQIER
jgi:hypothetical protein